MPGWPGRDFVSPEMLPGYRADVLRHRLSAQLLSRGCGIDGDKAYHLFVESVAVV